MKSGALIAAGIISLLPLLAVADPLHWQDGYIDRWGKQHKPDWRALKTDNGTNFVVDAKSVAPVGSSMRVFAYLVAGEEFEPENLITFTFDCSGAVDVASKFRLETIGPVIKEARRLACH